MSLFQASQQWLTMSSQEVKTWFESQLSRMNCQTLLKSSNNSTAVIRMVSETAIP